jgi:2-isopropylmalate synthase
LRKDLGVYQAVISDLELIDYKVRIFQGGTDAVTRVLIEIARRDRRALDDGRRVANIIDASFQALLDSIIYKLVRSGAKPAKG